MLNKRILVTGGAGYIGSKIVADLIKKDYQVYVIDNLSTGHKKLINKKALFYNFSIGNKKKLNNFFSKTKINSIIHCAASLNIAESEKKPKKYFVNNYVNTKKLLEVSINHNLKNFIFSSTAAVYGNANGFVNEKTLTKPINIYGKTKLKCEQIIKKYSKNKKFNYGILRYFNVGGSDMKNKIGSISKNNPLIKNIAHSIVQKKNKVSIFGNNYKTKDGTCIRDFIYLNDISQIHCKLLKLISKKNKSFLLNCGYGKGYSVLEVVRCFEKKFKINIKKEFLPRRKGDIAEIMSSTKNINKIIKINKKNKLIKIISSTVEWEKYLKKKS